jgi:carbamoyl-phosphate synthase large subunit
MRSKIRLGEVCGKAGLDFPRTKIISDVEVLYHLSDEIPLPYVLKGMFYGASVVQSIDEALAAFYKTTAQWGFPVIIQEFLEGEEYDIVAVGDGSGHIVGALPMKKTYLTDKGKGWAGVIVKDPRLLEMTESFAI